MAPIGMGIFDSIKSKFRRTPKWPSLSLKTIRRRARLLVIDDTEFAYIPLLREDGYTVTKWNDVQDLTKLEEHEYDIILLDIHGVAEDRASEGGLGLLKHLKTVAPAQIVVAYSAADFSLKFKSFFDQADAALEKGADYVKFKEVIDRLLKRRFSLQFYLDRIEQIAGSHQTDSAQLREKGKQAILHHDTTILENYLTSSEVNSDNIDRALRVAETGITLLQVIASL